MIPVPETRAMLWMMVLGGLVAVFVVVPYLVGMMLRDEYRSELFVLLPAELDRVWSELLHHEAHPFSGVMASRMLPAHDELQERSAGPAWIEDLGNARLEVFTVAIEPPHRWELELDDVRVPMASRWTFELSTHEEGTLVRATNRTLVRSGSWLSPVYRLVMRSTGATEKILREYFRSIADAMHVTSRLVPPQMQISDAERVVS